MSIKDYNWYNDLAREFPNIAPKVSMYKIDSYAAIMDLIAEFVKDEKVNVEESLSFTKTIVSYAMDENTRQHRNKELNRVAYVYSLFFLIFFGVFSMSFLVLTFSMSIESVPEWAIAIISGIIGGLSTNLKNVADNVIGNK